MAGTKAGGKLAAATNKLKYGGDFYANIGSKGGKLGTTGGFATKTPCNCSLFSYGHTKPMCAGAKGGQISRRQPKET